MQDQREALVPLEFLQVLHTFPSRQIEQDQHAQHLRLCPALRAAAHHDVPSDGIAKAHEVSEVEVDRKTRKPVRVDFLDSTSSW